VLHSSCDTNGNAHSFDNDDDLPKVTRYAQYNIMFVELHQHELAGKTAGYI